MGSTILRMEELGQRYSAVISTGLYLKLNEYLSGQRGPLYTFQHCLGNDVFNWPL